MTPELRIKIVSALWEATIRSSDDAIDVIERIYREQGDNVFTDPETSEKRAERRRGSCQCETVPASSWDHAPHCPERRE